MNILNGLISELETFKVRNISLYEAEGKSILADYFIVSTVDSVTQMEAARSKLMDYMWKFKIPLKNPQEDWHGGWCLLDFGNIIVHMFLEETRSFFDIDTLLKSENFNLEEIKSSHDLETISI